jgi:tripartite-type tricarboxylate transporter receptor subunit TctC
MLGISRRLAFGVGFAGLAASAAFAQSFPSRPITLVVPFAAGGPSDSIARLVGNSMSQTLGQNVLIENVAGAGGTAGAGRVAKAEPDGHTILIHHVALAAGATMYPKAPYDTLTAFEPIGLINFGPFVLNSKKGLGLGDVNSALAHIRSNKDKVRMGHAGVGSGSHLCNMLLQSSLGVTVTEIAYRGTGPAMNDLVAGQLDMLCDQTTNALPQIKAGTIVPHAVTALERVDQLKELPTLQEVGLAGFEVTVWHALYAPKGTPKPVIDQFYTALEKALAEPVIRERFEQLGTQMFPPGKRDGAATREVLTREVAKWAKVIKEAGVVQ